MNKELYSTLDRAVDVLRGKMDANDYKSYQLGLIFYKYISDKILDENYELREYYPEHDTGDRLDFYTNIYNHPVDGEDLRGDLLSTYSFYFEPEHTYDAIIRNIHDFNMGMLTKAIGDIELSDNFEGLFDDMNLESNRLGRSVKAREETIVELLAVLSELDLSEYNGDIMGDAYEYLIGQFALGMGKQGGEFYTPQEISKLMARIAIDGREDERGLSVYDATCGTGSLFLSVKDEVNHPDTIHYYGQELNPSSYNLAKMNLLMHGVYVDNFQLYNGDTLEDGWPSDYKSKFDMVLMNPPYSIGWDNSKDKLKDPRFAPYGGRLAPKGRADFAFLQHGLHHLEDDGTMAILLPHGPLFRNTEKVLRECLLLDGIIDAVIGMPANVFHNTTIPTVLLILKKGRKEKDDVLFIDASELFERERSTDTMTDEHVDEIYKMYEDRKFVDKMAYVASYDELEDNDFNLNIPRYVDTFEEAEEICLSELTERMRATQAEIEDKERTLLGFLDNMVSSDDEVSKGLEAFKSYLRE